MEKIGVYQMIILQEYFAKKSRPSKDDKARAKKLDERLALLVDTLVFMECKPSA